MSQPNLFHHRATVVPFPADRQLGRVHHIVGVIMRKQTQDAAQSYWQQAVLKELRQTLHSYGLSCEQIDYQEKQLHRAVTSELARLGWFNSGRQQSGPNDVA